MLEIKNVSKTFAKDTVNEHKALNNINLTLNDLTARIFPLCLSTKEQGLSEGFSKTL